MISEGVFSCWVNMLQLKDLSDRQQKEPLKLPEKKQINFPFNLPSWVIKCLYC